MHHTWTIALAVLLSTGAASAQQADEARSAIARKAKSGDRLTISTIDGTELKGRLVSMAPDALVLQVETVQRTLRYADIDRVKRRKNGVLLGALIGAGAGLAAGLPLKSLVDNETGEGDSVLAFFLGVGIGAGVGIDALFGSSPTVYRRPSGTVRHTFTVEPRKGGAAVRWGATW